MSVPLDQFSQRMGAAPQLNVTPNWTIDVSDIKTVKVSHISLVATEQDIKEFFSFSGEVQYVEMQSESERSQLAYVTFKESQGADTAILLSGATIVDLPVTITPVENYQLPPQAYKYISGNGNYSPASNPTVKKAEDVVSSMLAKGFVLGKDALNKARSLDEQHHIISTVASLDRRIGLSEKLSTGTAAVSGKVREVDERFQVSGMTRSAFAAAEHTASAAGSAIMSNQYVSMGASWISGALKGVVQAAGDVGVMTREKMEKAEEERKEVISRERNGMVSEYAQLHLDDSTLGESQVGMSESVEERRLGII